jgi:hypothetical protein
MIVESYKFATKNMDQNNEDNKGIDLSHTPDDSSSRVKFEGEQQYTRQYYPDIPKIVQWVMKYSGGLVKDEKTASYVLLGFVALAIIIALFFFFGGSEKNTPPPIMDDTFNRTIQN